MTCVYTGLGAAYPRGTFQNGAYPSGTFQNAAYPTGAFQNAAYPNGTFQHGAYPPCSDVPADARYTEDGAGAAVDPRYEEDGITIRTTE